MVDTDEVFGHGMLVQASYTVGLDLVVLVLGLVYHNDDFAEFLIPALRQEERVREVAE
jgi:hypothetical protein